MAGHNRRYTAQSECDFGNLCPHGSGGVDIANLELGKTDSSGPLNLADLNIELGPGDTLTISAESAGANDAAATLTWQELF